MVRQVAPTVGGDHRPFVSVVVPCRNEAGYISRTLDAFARQSYPSDRLEVLVVDGCSADGTIDAVQEAQRELPIRIRLLHNPHRWTPHALNIGVRAAVGEVIMVMGAHSMPTETYVMGCVETLNRTGAACVGGVLTTFGETRTARAIASAQSSPFGVGNARFRTGGGKAGPVDTVAFAAYRRTVFEEMGLFDEELVRNQDDEFNYRLVQAGYTVWLEPGLSVTYFSRAHLGKLWRQYFEYGLYKVRVMQKRRAVPSIRQLAPPAFVTGLALGAGLALAGRPKPLIGLIGSYSLATCIAARSQDCRNPALIVAFVAMHVSYGTGVLMGIPHWWGIVVSPPPNLAASSKMRSADADGSVIK